MVENTVVAPLDEFEEALRAVRRESFRVDVLADTVIHGLVPTGNLPLMIGTYDRASTRGARYVKCIILTKLNIALIIGLSLYVVGGYNPAFQSSERGFRLKFFRFSAWLKTLETTPAARGLAARKFSSPRLPTTLLRRENLPALLEQTALTRAADMRCAEARCRRANGSVPRNGLRPAERRGRPASAWPRARSERADLRLG
jgi:hypothetical protein